MRIKFGCTAVALLLLVSGCAGMKQVKKIEPGDRLLVRYTCSADGYGAIETTDRKVAADLSVQKSRVFLPEKANGAVILIAGQNQDLAFGDIKYLTDEIHNQIARELVGKSRGGSYKMVIQSQVPKGLKDSQRYRIVQRERVVSRIRENERRRFTGDLGHEPKVGELLYRDGLPYAEVVGIRSDAVSLKLITDNGLRIDTFGGTMSAVSTDEEDKVKVVIDSHEGLLVRTGPVIGRVIRVDEKSIVIDYGHPFAGQKLECRVEVLDPETQKE